LIIDRIIGEKCPNCSNKMKFITKRKMRAKKDYKIKVFLCKKCGNTYKKVI
jgi:DNA-directed RNA polymerase subunit M/transcription elongation factor TFIIS